MILSLDLLYKAFGSHPLLRAQFQQLDRTLSDTTATAQSASDAAASAQASADLANSLTWQPPSHLLTAISNIPTDLIGAIEITGVGQVTAREINTTDDASLITKAYADTLYAAHGGGVATFNGRAGAVSLTSGDVTTALGFTPQVAGSYLVTTNNLSDLSNTATARTNLGLGTAGTHAATDFLQVSSNLSDLGSTSTARSNLGLLRLVAFFFTTTPTASEVLALYTAADAFTIPANMSGSQVKTGANPTSTFAIDVQQNGTSIGTISIATSGTATLTTTSGTSKSIAVGDVIKFVAPSSTDATIANVAITVKGAL